MSKISSARDIRIEEYLSYPELRIPMFQREYVWEAEQIEEFWDDLTKNDMEFLGSIILKNDQYKSDSREGFLEIVDGQQRSVSLLILLKAISRQLMILAGARQEPYEENAEKHSEQIDNVISKKDRHDLTKVLSYKLTLPNPPDNEAFKDILDGNVDKYKKGQYKNFYTSTQKLELSLLSYLETKETKKDKIDALITLKNRIYDIKIVQVLVPTDEDAYMIFEAVNDRGADLGAAELLKNYIFAKTPKEEQTVVYDEWKKITKTLLDIERKAIDLTGFLRYYWIGKYEHLPKKKLYGSIKRRMTDPKLPKLTPEMVLSEVSSFRSTLEKIYLYELDEWQALFDSNRSVQRKAYEWFTFKKNLDFFQKSIQYLPIYTAIVGNLDKVPQSAKTFFELFLAIEKINFFYSYILQKPTNKIDTLLSGIGREILAEIEKTKKEETVESAEILQKVSTGISKIEKILKENVNKKDIDDFIANLNYKKTSDKNIIYFILLNLEYAAGGYNRPLIPTNLSLEHIYPKSIEKKGQVEGWQKLDFDYAKIGHGLGNLTFLQESGPQANGSAGEESFDIKRDNFLKPSNYSINNYFSNVEKWDGDEIKKRLAFIQDAVWTRWGPKDDGNKVIENEELVEQVVL